MISRLRLDELQKEYSDPLLSVLTVLLVIMLFVVAPFQAAGIMMFEAFGVIVALVMVASVLVISATNGDTRDIGCVFIERLRGHRAAYQAFDI
jgi:hypothetical protein